jgi:hypothetical protein
MTSVDESEKERNDRRKIGKDIEIRKEYEGQKEKMSERCTRNEIRKWT